MRSALRAGSLPRHLFPPSTRTLLRLSSSLSLSVCVSQTTPAPAHPHDEGRARGHRRPGCLGRRRAAGLASRRRPRRDSGEARDDAAGLWRGRFARRRLTWGVAGSCRSRRSEKAGAGPGPRCRCRRRGSLVASTRRAAASGVSAPRLAGAKAGVPRLAKTSPSASWGRPPPPGRALRVRDNGRPLHNGRPPATAGLVSGPGTTARHVPRAAPPGPGTTAGLVLGPGATASHTATTDLPELIFPAGPSGLPGLVFPASPSRLSGLNFPARLSAPAF